MNRSLLVVLLLAVLAAHACVEAALSREPRSPEPQPGAMHEPKRNADGALEFLEVFVLPHSHDDVGWIVTLEQYYSSEVQYIYDTVIQNLKNDATRKFIFVEVGYLQRWWRDASEQSRNDLKDLYRKGQVEFIIGGIVMPDEAAASYVAVINQLQQGHQFLTETFGAIPRIGWQIDPFGASQGLTE